MTSISFFLYFNTLTDNKWFDTSLGWYLIISATLVFTKSAIFKHLHFGSVFFELFWSLPIWFCNHLILPKKLRMFYPLTWKSICKQSTLAMWFLLLLFFCLLSVVYRSFKYRNSRVRPANTVCYEKWFLSHSF